MPAPARAPCDLCEGSDWEVVSHWDREGNPLETALCNACGLVRQLDPPSEQDLDAYYAERYRQDYHGESRPSRRRVVRAWRRGQALFERLRAHVAPAGPVLDVGAGLGLNLRPFQRAGHRVRGIEPNHAWRAFAQDPLGVPLDDGRLEHLEAEEGFDLIIITHVIEHLRSPRAGLERLRGLLRDGGRIYLECPNVSAPFAPPARLFHRAHIHDLSAATVRVLARACGLRVERSFAPDDDPTVAVLLVPDGAPRLELDPDAARSVRRALATGWAGYHLRPAYLSLRALKLRESLSELLTGERAYRRLLGSGPSADGSPRARAE